MKQWLNLVLAAVFFVGKKLLSCIVRVEKKEDFLNLIKGRNALFFDFS